MNVRIRKGSAWFDKWEWEKDDVRDREIGMKGHMERK